MSRSEYVAGREDRQLWYRVGRRVLNVTVWDRGIDRQRVP